MTRVWFNHWFSTSYRLIELMKQDREVHIIGSNKQVDSVIQKVCDEWYQDSLLGGDEYVDYCLDFCREHEVSVFVPRRLMVEISRRKAEFEALGVGVMVDDYDIIKLLNDKASTYEFFKNTEGINIPDYYIVNNAEKFEAAYRSLKNKYDRICVKFVKDEGGMSFRKITETAGDPFKSLRIYSGMEMTYEAYLSALRQVATFDELMVMPYLPGEEISVDCLMTKSGLIAVPRIKGSARHEKVVFDEKILAMTKIVYDKINLQYPCNIQFKLKDDIPYLLEINTRMSGGLQMSCLAADVNIPGIALDKILGINTEWTMDRTNKVVSYIEIPEIIK